MSIRSKISANIRTNILKVIEEKYPRPVSSNEIALKIDRAWHSIQNHCLKLQLDGIIDGFRVGNMNLWVLKKK